MSLRIEPRPVADPDARGLIAQLQDLYVELYGGHDRDLVEPAEFTPPHGLFLIGYDTMGGADVPIACGGWRRHDDSSAEIKRMFVVPGARGRGVARRMLAELETTAADAGVAVMTLNTGYRQTDALAFYAACGYHPSAERFGHYEHIEGAYFFSKSLER